MHSVSDAWTLTAVSCSLCCFARRELDATDCFALCRYSNHSYYDKTTPIRVLTLLTSMAIPNYPLATSTDMSHWSSDCCSSAFLCREMGNDRSCAQRLAFREEAATEKSYYSVLTLNDLCVSGRQSRQGSDAADPMGSDGKALFYQAVDFSK